MGGGGLGGVFPGGWMSKCLASGRNILWLLQIETDDQNGGSPDIMPGSLVTTHTLLFQNEAKLQTNPPRTLNIKIQNL